jgi:hypothetical protein
MALVPWGIRAAGLRMQVGTSAELAEAGHEVLAEVWRAKGVTPAAGARSYGERYDRATTWIVAFDGTRPVGVMGLLDMRIASMALDYGNHTVPRWLDLTTTREIGRLAILPRHRGGGQAAMTALVLTMYRQALSMKLEKLFSGSTLSLFHMYRRFNPTGRLISAADAGPEDPARARYFAPLRAYGGPGVLYTFDVEGASPSDVAYRFVTGRLGKTEERMSPANSRATERAAQRDSTVTGKGHGA